MGKLQRILLYSFLWIGLSACIATVQEAEPTAGSSAAVVEDLEWYSEALQTEVSCTVILPESYAQDSLKRFPVVYLLHGYSGNHRDWIDKVADLPLWASLFDLMMVLPDGGYNSWYLDPPLPSGKKYATHVAREIPDFIDARFRTIARKEGRAITGLSMGGHGALYLGLHYPEQFGAMGSMSGGLDLRPFPKNWEIAELLGAQSEKPENWKTFSVVPNLALLQQRPEPAPLIIDCGKDDFFLEVNLAAHRTLDSLGYQHDFIIRPGAHNWEYWSNAVPYQLLFFDRFFEH